MPTTRPRHTVTETDAVARALDRAARRWPEEPNRQRLLLRLIEEGERAVLAAEDAQVAERRERILRHSGVATGIYPPRYLDDLRADWPD
jgi:hypothetical protein